MSDILEVSRFKQLNNKRLLMKQEQLKVTIADILSNPNTKWLNLNNSSLFKTIHVTKVILSKDSSRALVFIGDYKYQSSILKDSTSSLKEAMVQLKEEAGTIKHMLTQRLYLRKIPKLTFKVDAESNKVFDVLSLLDDIKSKDSE